MIKKPAAYQRVEVLKSAAYQRIDSPIFRGHMPKVPHDGRGQRRPRRKRSERLPYCITIGVAGVGDGDEGGSEETGIGINLPPATRTTYDTVCQSCGVKGAIASKKFSIRLDV